MKVLQLQTLKQYKSESEMMIQKVRAQEDEPKGQKRSAVDRLGREFEMMISFFSLLY